MASKCEDCGAWLADCFSACSVCGSEYERPVDVRKRGIVELRGERVVTFGREDVIILNAKIRHMQIDGEDCLVIRHNPHKCPELPGCHVTFHDAKGPLQITSPRTPTV